MTCHQVLLQCLGLSWISPGCSHRVGRSCELTPKATHLAFWCFCWKRSSLHLLYPEPKEAVLVLLPVAVGSCPCEWHSLAGSAGHTGAAHPFQASWESTGAPGDPKPSGQHMFTGRLCPRHCCWCRGRLSPAVQDKEFFVQHQISLPSYCA